MLTNYSHLCEDTIMLRISFSQLLENTMPINLCRSVDIFTLSSAWKWTLLWHYKCPKARVTLLKFITAHSDNIFRKQDAHKCLPVVVSSHTQWPLQRFLLFVSKLSKVTFPPHRLPLKQALVSTCRVTECGTSPWPCSWWSCTATACCSRPCTGWWWPAPCCCSVPSLATGWTGIPDSKARNIFWNGS